MAFLAAPAFATAVGSLSGLFGIGAGIHSIISGSKKGDKSPSAPAPLPKAPTAEDAAIKAKADLQKRRRISVLSGGVTDVTRGKALVSEEQVGKKSLLGA
jgi:hypothetical protein